MSDKKAECKWRRERVRKERYRSFWKPVTLKKLSQNYQNQKRGIFLGYCCSWSSIWRLFLVWRTERICSTFKIIVSHFYILRVLCSYHWQYKLSIYRVSSTVDGIIFLSLSDAQACTNIPLAFGRISFPKKKDVWTKATSFWNYAGRKP